MAATIKPSKKLNGYHLKNALMANMSDQEFYKFCKEHEVLKKEYSAKMKFS